MSSGERLVHRVSEVAQLTGVSESTVRRWVESGQLIACRPGGVVLIKPADLEAFIDSTREGLTVPRLRSTA